SDELLKMPKAIFAEGAGMMQVTEWSPRHIRLEADIISPEARLLLHRFYFPGWQAQEYTIEPYKALISVTVPQGEHSLDITLPYFKGERLGLQISLAAGILWLFTALALRRKWKASS